MAETFFTVDDAEWFTPQAHARGPWDPNACHAGPPSALLARAMEHAVPGARLTRLTVDLTRPIPFAGFAVMARVTRQGRTVSTTEAAIVDADGKELVRATGLHLATAAVPAADAAARTMPTITEHVPDLAHARPGPFPISGGGGHGLPGFTGGVEVRYPEGEDATPGPTTIWMRTVPMLPDEEPSPFQRICPLADCGNAIGRNAEPSQVRFVNPDLTVVLHRDPVGEWFASRSVSRWEPTGIGLADALLFDREGLVGRACQTLLLTPVGG